MSAWSGRPPFRTLTPVYEQLNGPSAEPMSIVEAKLQCRRATDESSEDLLWRRIIEAARDQVEADTNRCICWQRWRLSLDQWPDIFELYKCPVRAVETVEYQDLTTAGAWQTVDSDEYVFSASEPGRVNSSYSNYWQPARFQMSAVRVTFTAGYVVPFTVTAATDTLTFTDYAPTNGNTFRLTNSGGQLPSGLSERVTYYIVNASGSTCKLSLTSGGGAVDITSAGVGIHYLGEIPQSLMQAMRKRVAVEFADREGSDIAAKCEESYYQSLRPLRYTVL